MFKTKAWIVTAVSVLLAVGFGCSSTPDDAPSEEQASASPPVETTQPAVPTASTETMTDTTTTTASSTTASTSGSGGASLGASSSGRGR
jgi:hypothetical protein